MGTITICSLILTAIMSCLYDEGGSGTRGTGGNPHRQVDMSKIALPKMADPMIWGGYYRGETEDLILPGSKDTSKSCREYLEQNVNQTTPISNPSTQGFREDILIFEPRQNMYEQYQYTPVYQAAETYEGLLGTAVDAELLNPGKIYMKGHFKFVGDINRGIHIYDYSVPDLPILVAFIYLPGNIDIAIKNNMLYANSYSNLVALDISNPLNTRLAKVLRQAFPRVYKYGFPMIDSSGGLAVAWKRDTIVQCGDLEIKYDILVQSNAVEFDERASDSISSLKTTDTFGKGGSMARFEISSRYLYAVDQRYLNVFDISEEGNPTDVRDIHVGWGLETIFKTEKALFIGANTGMYIHDLQDPGNPHQASLYQHVTSCDPVVVQNDMAYVTLRSGSFCRRGANTLDIIDVSDIYAPKQIAVHNMINPHGLAVSDTLLYLCEGESGFKVLSVNDPLNPVLLSHETGLHAFDVIFDSGELTVIGNNGVYVYDTSDPYQLQRLSHTQPETEGKGFVPNDNRIFFDPIMIVD